MPDAAAPPPSIVFDVSGHPMALPVTAVVRVLPLPRLDRLPASPPVIAGLFRHGAALVPVLHLDVLLGLPAALPGLYRPLLLCRRPGGLVAYLCGRVMGLVTPPSLAPLPPPNGALVPLSFNRCVAGRFEHGGAACLLLDPERLLTAAEEQSLDAHRRIAEERAAAWAGPPVWTGDAAEDTP